jgi:hypothetical protein
MLDDSPADIANWICGSLSLVILIARLGIYFYNKIPIDATYFLCTASIFILIAQIIVRYYYLRLGTANDVFTSTPDYVSLDVAAIKKGSIFVLVSRVIATTLYWLQACLLLLFYSRIIHELRWIATRIRAMINICWFTIAATYIAVILATLLECRPFTLYWQLSPRPSRCVQAYVQLFLQGICNIILDLMVLIIAVPLFNWKIRTWSQNLRICILYCLGIFCIVVNCIRVALIHSEQSAQSARSLWASIQQLLSIFVANVPTIYGNVRIALRREENRLALTS